MYYIVENNIRIRKWAGHPPVYDVNGKRKFHHLDQDEYALLKSCDGFTELSPNKTLYRMELMRLIRRCRKGEASLKPDQIREYPNHYIWGIEWTITERCNFNCLHCFHAADNKRQRAEFSREEAFRLLREIKECGVTGISLTGGEPTLYPYLRDVMTKARNLRLPLDSLVTNGAGLDEDMVGFIKDLYPRVQIRLSFDGIGTHDWLRQHEGAEEQVKDTIRRCKKAGLYVKINMNVNRRNRDVIFDSSVMLSDMGVDELRIIKTTEAPRWQLNAAGNSLTIEEYFDFSAAFAGKYKDYGLTLPVTIWHSLYLHGKTQVFSALPVKSSQCNYHDDLPLCEGMINKLSIQANGEIVPCGPLAGLFALKDIHLGNVKHDGLQKLLTGGSVIETISHTVGEKRSHNRQCGTCPYFMNCQGGCPALSALYNGSFLEPDPAKCAFFLGDYYNTFCHVLEGWKNKKPVP